MLKWVESAKLEKRKLPDFKYTPTPPNKMLTKKQVEKLVKKRLINDNISNLNKLGEDVINIGKQITGNNV